MLLCATAYIQAALEVAGQEQVVCERLRLKRVPLETEIRDWCVLVLIFYYRAKIVEHVSLFSIKRYFFSL